MQTQEEKLITCVKLMQSILNNGEFSVETPNEGALVKAMDIAGFPVKPMENLRNSESDYQMYLDDCKPDIGMPDIVADIIEETVFDIAGSVLYEAEDPSCCSTEEAFNIDSSNDCDDSYDDSYDDGGCCGDDD